MTTLTLDLFTPGELRLGAEWLLELADHREQSGTDVDTAEKWSPPKASLSAGEERFYEATADWTPENHAEHQRLVAEDAAREETATAKRKRRTKAEITADNAKIEASRAAEAAGTALSQATPLAGEAPAETKFVLRDSAGDPKAAFGDAATAAAALVEIFQAAPSLDSLDNLLSVNANVVSLIGAPLNDMVVVAYGGRQAELKAQPMAESKQPELKATPKAEAVQAPSDFIVTRIDGKTAGFTHAHMAADCFTKLLDGLTNDVSVKAFAALNVALFKKFDSETLANLSAVVQAKLKSFEVPKADDSASVDALFAEEAPLVEEVLETPASEVPTDPEELKNTVRDLLVAYIKRPDVGFTKGTEFMKLHAKADRFTKIDASLYPALYRLVKPLV